MSIGHRQFCQCFKTFFYTYVLFHLHVGISLAALYILTAYSAGRHPDLLYALFLFSATVLGYNYLRIIRLEQNRDFIRDFFGKNFPVFILINLSAVIISIYTLFHLPHGTVLHIVPFALLLFFYNTGAGKYKFFHWRNIGFIKILLIAVVWTGLTSIVPGFYDQAYHVFILVLLLIIPFDVRDLNLDTDSLKTLPQIFKKKTPYASSILFLLYLLTVIKIYLHNVPALTAWITMGILAAVSIIVSMKKRDYFFAAFYVEAIPLAGLIIYLLLSSSI